MFKRFSQFNLTHATRRKQLCTLHSNPESGLLERINKYEILMDMTLGFVGRVEFAGSAGRVEPFMN